MGFLSHEIFPSKLDIVWRFESLRQEMFAYFSPLSENREIFRKAFVSPARNVSGKPTLDWIYTQAGIDKVAEREAPWIKEGGYVPPSVKRVRERP